MPPGTGDVALSLSQTVPVAGAVLVTTPQTVSLADTRRAVQMYRKLNIPTIGLIENMSHFVCPDCGRESDIFGKGGGEALAAEMSVPFLGRDSALRAGAPRRRHRRADRHGRAGLGAGARAHRGRRARRAAGVDRVVLAARDSADAGELRREPVRSPLTQLPDSPIVDSCASLSPRPRSPNGLDVIVHEDHRVPLVAVSVWYHVGSKNERAGPTGLAHLFEHLMFEGSEHQPPRLLRAAAGSRRVAQRIDEHRSHELLGSRAEGSRARWRSGWKRIGWAGCCRR